jgi:NTE family protein
MKFLRTLPLLASLLLAGCFGHADTRPTAPPPTPAKIRVGLALGGGAAKGFAHIGVIKMLEASGIHPDVVAGTSAGSVVGALYASGMDAFALQEQAFSLDEAKIRDVGFFGGGLVKGELLEDYVNTLVNKRPIQSLRIPFAAVATNLQTGDRAVFVSGNTGQAVRASSSIPGVFQPTDINGVPYVDGGVVSPVPVDAARQLGADVVIAVDISAKASRTRPEGMMGVVSQSITIMGQKLGEQELSRADVVIRPKVGQIGPTDFDAKNVAILEGERAALAAIPAIKAAIAAKQAARATPAASVSK